MGGEALLDGVLVGAGEGREHEVTHVGMARVDGQTRAVLELARHSVDIGEVKSRHDTLGVHVERDGNDVHVAGTLAVAEQATFDAIGAGQQAHLGSRDGRAAVIVRM